VAAAAEAKRKADADAAAEAKRKADADAAAEAKRKADADAAAAAKRKADADAEAGRQAEADAEAARRASAEADAKRKADADAQAARNAASAAAASASANATDDADKAAAEVSRLEMSLAAAERKLAEASRPKAAPVEDLENPACIWNNFLSREEAEGKIAGNADGTFLIRKRSENPGQFIMALVFKGRPTHHLMEKVNGIWQINKKSYGSHATVGEVRNWTRRWKRKREWGGGLM
jgi:nucleoid-associated protein YgaU